MVSVQDVDSCHLGMSTLQSSQAEHAIKHHILCSLACHQTPHDEIPQLIALCIRISNEIANNALNAFLTKFWAIFGHHMR